MSEIHIFDLGDTVTTALGRYLVGEIREKLGENNHHL